MRCHSVPSLICDSRMKFTCLGRRTLKERKGEIPSEFIMKNCQMQAFWVGDAGNHNLPFRIMSRGWSWRHQNPYLVPKKYPSMLYFPFQYKHHICLFCDKTRIVVTFSLNRSRRSLSYKEWLTPRSKGLLGMGNSSFLIAKPVSTRIR